MNGLVSNSETDTFNTCRRRHYYAFGEKLQPKSFGDGLSRGILGHKALEILHKVIQSGESTAFALREMNIWFNDELLKAIKNNDVQNTELLTVLKPLLNEYVEFYERELNLYEYLAVEETFIFGLFPFTPDIVKRHKKTKQVIVEDHKFLYNFYNNVKTFPQLPKYVWGLRSLGYPVHSASYDMIRYRNNAQLKFKRTDADLKPKKVEQYRHEQEKITHRINALKQLTLEEWEEDTVRTANSFTCPSCPFRVLCETDLEGLPGRNLLVKSFFEPNTYGYELEVEFNE